MMMKKVKQCEVNYKDTAILNKTMWKTKKYLFFQKNFSIEKS